MRSYSDIPGYRLYLQTKLGSGASSIVYLGINKNTQNKVAIKVVPKNSLNNEVTKYLFEAQKYALTNIKSQYVIQAEDIISYGDHQHIIMQYCSFGTLRDYIQSKGQLSERQALNLFRKLVIGYCDIVDAHIIHRDLKTTNIMLRQNGDPVIIDFGYCQMIFGKRPTIRYNVGSPSYMPPQSYYQNLYCERSDVWSLGVIYYQMLTGKTVDQNKHIDNYFKQTKLKGIVQLQYNRFSQFSKKILKAALTVDTGKRATIHRLKYLIDIQLGPFGININQKAKIKGLQQQIQVKKNQLSQRKKFKDEMTFDTTYLNQGNFFNGSTINNNQILNKIFPTTNKNPLPSVKYNYIQTLASPSNLRKTCFSFHQDTFNMIGNKPGRINKTVYILNPQKVDKMLIQNSHKNENQFFPIKKSQIVTKTPQKLQRVAKTIQDQAYYTERSPRIQINRNYTPNKHANQYYTQRAPQKNIIMSQFSNKNDKSVKKQCLSGATEERRFISNKRSTIQHLQKSASSKNQKIVTRKQCYSINTSIIPQFQANTLNQYNSHQSNKVNSTYRRLGQKKRVETFKIKKQNKQTSIISPANIRRASPQESMTLSSPKYLNIDQILPQYKNRITYAYHNN